MSKHLAYYGFVLLVVSLTAVGCGQSSERYQTGSTTGVSTGTNDEANGGSEYCTTDFDCPGGEICVGGICEVIGGASNQGNANEGTSCQVHNDCPTGLLCNTATQTCVECLADEDCPLGNQCLSTGACGESGVCFDDADCTGGFVCDVDRSACVECLVDQHCDANQICSDSVCAARPSDGIACNDISDCAVYAYVCDSFTETCRPCVNDNECGVGRVCDAGGLCMNDTSGGGSTDTCTSAYDCPAGQGCRSGSCGACVYGWDCRDGETCSQGTCIADSAPDCFQNSDCFGGQVCSGGSCVACTTSSQCEGGQICINGACTSSGSGGGTDLSPLGASCVSDSNCESGLNCLGINNASFCSRSCIGSGQGGSADCPSGFACYNFDSGTMDGMSVCIPASVMPETLTDGTTFPGQPFDLLPGESCSDTNPGCQTLHCFSGECMRACLSNRDCNSSEVCYSGWIDDTANATQTMTDVQFCAVSDTFSYKATGASCNSGIECDSGVCGGLCSNDNTQICNSSADCNGGTCTGACMDHCRSNADCGASQACAGWPTDAVAQTGWVSVCQGKIGTGTLADGASCSASTDCSSDWCVGGICSTVCGLDSDCSGGLAGTQCQMVVLSDASDNPIYTSQFCVP